MDVYIAKVTDSLQGLVATYGAGPLAIGGAAVLILLLLILRLRRSRPGGAVSDSPERDYAALETLDISESERLRRLLAERADWQALPDRLLDEISLRLRSKDDVFGFISLAETHRLLTGLLSRLDGTDIDADISAVAACIADLAGKHPDDAAAALRIATRIDPDNFHVVLGLAGDHFDAGRYQEALQLLERGIPICRDAVEKTGAGDSLRQLLQKSMDMYEACLARESSV